MRICTANHPVEQRLRSLEEKLRELDLSIVHHEYNGIQIQDDKTGKLYNIVNADFGYRTDTTQLPRFTEGERLAEETS